MIFLRLLCLKLYSQLNNLVVFTKGKIHTCTVENLILSNISPMLSTYKPEGTRFIPVIALSQSLFYDTLFILASVLWLFLFTLSGLAEEASYIPLLVTQYPTITIITRHDALVSLFPFKLLVLCLSFVCLAFYVACFYEPCVFWALEEVYYLGLWLSCSAQCLLEPCGHSLKRPPPSTIKLYLLCACRIFLSL